MTDSCQEFALKAVDLCQFDCAFLKRFKQPGILISCCGLACKNPRQVTFLLQEAANRAFAIQHEQAKLSLSLDQRHREGALDAFLGYECAVRLALEIRLLTINRPGGIPDLLTRCLDLYVIVLDEASREAN